MGVIYKVTCSINNKVYIGQTRQSLEERRRQHEKTNDKTKFHRALRKYSFSNFIWEIIEECDNVSLNEREKYWIAYYDSYKFGYNMTPGGDEDYDSLKKWMEQNPEKVRLNGSKNMKKYWEDRPEEAMEVRNRAAKKALEKTKKPVRCIELNLIFDSMSEAARWSESEKNPNHLKASVQHISRVCRGERKTTGGYHWEYVKNNEF